MLKINNEILDAQPGMAIGVKILMIKTVNIANKDKIMPTNEKYYLVDSSTCNPGKSFNQVAGRGGTYAGSVETQPGIITEEPIVNYTGGNETRPRNISLYIYIKINVNKWKIQ